jgi:hypothetical protein
MNENLTSVQLAPASYAVRRWTTDPWTNTGAGLPRITKNAATVGCVTDQFVLVIQWRRLSCKGQTTWKDDHEWEVGIWKEGDSALFLSTIQVFGRRNWRKPRNRLGCRNLKKIGTGDLPNTRLRHSKWMTAFPSWFYSVLMVTCWVGEIKVKMGRTYGTDGGG